MAVVLGCSSIGPTGRLGRCTHGATMTAYGAVRFTSARRLLGFLRDTQGEQAHRAGDNDAD